MCVRARTSVCACALLLALVIAEHDKRDEMSPNPFLVATRFGRSAPQVRRNDRVFFNVRYGKRSEGAWEGAWLGGGGGESAVARGAGAAGSALLCKFTGVFPLYRCRHKPPAHSERSAEVTREEE